MATRTKSDTALLAIGVFVGLLVVVAVVFAIQPPAQFDPDTPEGTAQGYYQAVNARDDDLAETFLVADLVRECDWNWWFEHEDETARVVVTNTSISGDGAEVDVAISISYGSDPFGGGSYDERDTLAMTWTGDLWLISEPAWPMEPYSCKDREA